MNLVQNNPTQEDLEKIAKELKIKGSPVIKLNAKNLRRDEDKNLHVSRYIFYPEENNPIRAQFINLSNITSVRILNIIDNVIRKNGLNFSGANFEKADFRWADLKGANFKRANLSRVNLSGTTLKDTNLRWADLSDVNFSLSVDLRGADLRGAKLNKKTTLPSYLNENSPLFPFSEKQINQLSENEQIKAKNFNKKFEENNKTEIFGIKVSGVLNVTVKKAYSDNSAFLDIPLSPKIIGAIVIELFNSAKAYIFKR